MEQILVVDDSHLIRSFVKMGLKKYGFDALLFEDASKAYRALGEEKGPMPRLIFADVDMPKITGYSFVRMLKSDPRTKYIPIVMVTSNNTEWDRKHAKECGVVDFVVKPFPIETLITIVKRHAITPTIPVTEAAPVQS